MIHIKCIYTSHAPSNLVYAHHVCWCEMMTTTTPNPCRWISHRLLPSSYPQTGPTVDQPYAPPHMAAVQMGCRVAPCACGWGFHNGTNGGGSSFQQPAAGIWMLEVVLFQPQHHVMAEMYTSQNFYQGAATIVMMAHINNICSAEWSCSPPSGHRSSLCIGVFIQPPHPSPPTTCLNSLLLPVLGESAS